MRAVDTGTWYLMKSQPHWRRSTPPLDVTTGEDYLLVSVSPPKFSRSESTKLTFVLCTWWHGYIRGWWHWWTGWCRSRQKFRKISATMQRKRNQAIQIEAQTQVHRILLPGTPCHQRRPETRLGQDKGCARNAETGQHQSSQTILWIRQLLGKVYAETKWSHGAY